MGALKLSYYSNVISEIPLRENLYLGNVNVVLSDRKYAIDDDNDGTVDYYSPDILMTMDYYPFGQEIASRSAVGTSYKYGYNGMDKDDEVSGNGNSYTTEFRQYDARLGRWKSLDPLMTKFPWMSPFVAFDNNPVYYNDPRGLASKKGGGCKGGKRGQGEFGKRKHNHGKAGPLKGLGKFIGKGFKSIGSAIKKGYNNLKSFIGGVFSKDDKKKSSAPKGKIPTVVIDEPTGVPLGDEKSGWDEFLTLLRKIDNYNDGYHDGGHHGGWGGSASNEIRGGIAGISAVITIGTGGFSLLAEGGSAIGVGLTYMSMASTIDDLSGLAGGTTILEKMIGDKNAKYLQGSKIILSFMGSKTALLNFTKNMNNKQKSALDIISFINDQGNVVFGIYNIIDTPKSIQRKIDKTQTLSPGDIKW